MGIKEAIVEVKAQQPDAKLIDLDNPEATTIRIDIHTDTRLAGMNMLIHTVAQALADQGYQNVEVRSGQDHETMMRATQEANGLFAPRPEERAALKRVTVVVADATLDKEQQRPQHVSANAANVTQREEVIDLL